MKIYVEYVARRMAPMEISGNFKCVFSRPGKNLTVSKIFCKKNCNYSNFLYFFSVIKYIEYIEVRNESL